MIKTLLAHTHELDEVEDAVAEILEQLDLDNKLLKNSVGILSCYAEFIDTGVVESLCAALPFDVVGVTSLASSIGADAIGVEILTLCVLTSDDVAFTTVLTESLEKDQETPIQDAWNKASAATPQPPALLLTYAPMLNHVGGEKLVVQINEKSGGVPLFGTMFCAHTYDFKDAYVIHNGKSYKDRLTLTLVSGPVEPEFFFISIEGGGALTQKAVITASSGNILQSVNGIPAVDYLASLGLTAESGLQGSVAIPFLVDYGDGTRPVCRGLFMLTEEGYAICGGDVPQGSYLSTSNLDYAEVMRTAQEVLDSVFASGKKDALLIVSCQSRSLVLGMDALAEAQYLHQKLDGHMPCHLMYSGGEICPSPTREGELKNRFHNFSLVACAL
ncbi:FIST C-terminal domain-containing protein [Desulfovibrio sp. OttesenSCG-928-C14]|nr:FIST C-terminal domain-containing protein [Desulfovibrio sp. OttesenSCG-928-C14]